MFSLGSETEPNLCIFCDPFIIDEEFTGVGLEWGGLVANLWLAGEGRWCTEGRGLVWVEAFPSWEELNGRSISCLMEFRREEPPVPPLPLLGVDTCPPPPGVFVVKFGWLVPWNDDREGASTSCMSGLIIISSNLLWCWKLGGCCCSCCPKSGRCCCSKRASSRSGVGCWCCGWCFVIFAPRTSCLCDWSTCTTWFCCCCWWWLYTLRYGTVHQASSILFCIFLGQNLFIVFSKTAALTFWSPWKKSCCEVSIASALLTRLWFWPVDGDWRTN